MESNPLLHFSGVLLDMNSTFMFGEDRFGPDQDYHATYAGLGGQQLEPPTVQEVVLACYEHMRVIYEDPSRCDSFPQVRDVLALLPPSCDLPRSERMLLEQVIAAHELGRIPERYAAALQRLARTHRLGIVCNLWSSKGPWLAELERTGVLELLASVVFSSDGSSMKPSRTLFDLAVSQLGLPPSEILFVGDSLRCDIAGAAAAGLASAWIDHQGQGCPDEGPRPKWIIRDLLDLIEPGGSGSLHISIATEADIPEMHRIRMSVRENQLNNPALVQPHHYHEMLHEHGRGWVARVDGRIAGFAVADLTRSNIWALFVDPEAEGKGVGRRLHDAMMDWFFDAGAERVWLSTDPGTRADRFYQSAGWRYAGREPNGENRYEMVREDWLVLRT